MRDGKFITRVLVTTCRRGVSNRFVPPIRKDLEEGDKTRGKGYSSEAEIRSRVLRGGEGSSDRKDGMTG